MEIKGATPHLRNLPDNIIKVELNINFAKARIQPREPQPLDNGGYQTELWLGQMTHFTRPWTQHTQAQTHALSLTRGQF